MNLSEFENGYEKGYMAAIRKIKAELENIDLNDGDNQKLNAVGMKMLVMKILDKGY